MSPFVNDPDFVLHVGDALDVLATMPDESVHSVVTSPPYWGLRDYGTEGQLGLEPTPEEYVSSMVAVFREVRRVMRRDATLWLNLGDSFGDKQMAGIPWKVAFALQADGWYLRSDIIWSKPNPMPESVSDRPTKAHEYLFLLTRSPRYFYDADAIREPHAPDGRAVTRVVGQDGSLQHRDGERWPGAGRNKRSVWEIATEPYPDAHFATFPQALVEPCVLAGTSERGCCPVCGAPWERETTSQRGDMEAHARPKHLQSSCSGLSLSGNGSKEWAERGAKRATTGWRPTCECVESSDIQKSLIFRPDPCTVLDPFMGSGTVAVVARRLGRRAVGIELNPKYARLASTRLQQLSLLAA